MNQIQILLELPFVFPHFLLRRKNTDIFSLKIFPQKMQFSNKNLHAESKKIKTKKGKKEQFFRTPKFADGCKFSADTFFSA